MRRRATKPIDSSRRGAVAVLVAVSMTALLGVLALSVDTGRLFDQQRRAQAAADAAAFAGATELYRHATSGTDLRQAADPAFVAYDFAARNGFPNSTPHRVTVSIPPTHGQFAGRAGFVQVDIESMVPRTFSRIYGSDNLTVKSSSVAGGTLLPTKASLLVLDPKAKHALKLKGKSTGLKTSGTVFVNSKSKSAVQFDKQSQVQADALMVTGGMDKKSKGYFEGDLSTGVAPTEDPLDGLPVPPKGTELKAADYMTSINGGKYYQLPPGTYKDLKFTNADVVELQPGTYYIDGAFQVSKSASISGSKVTLYFSGKKDVRFDTKGAVTLTPPTSGVYSGVTMFIDRSSKKKLLFRKDADLNIAGIIYAPNSEVKFQHTDAFLGDDIDEPEEDDSSDIEDDGDGTPASQGSLSAALIARKLVVDKHSQVSLTGNSIAAQRSFLGLIE